MADVNVATLRAGYDALNRGDLSEVMALIADDITWDPGELTPDRDAEATGPAGFESLIRSWIDAFDDFHIEPLEVTERGHFLIASVRQSGRGRASGLDISIEIAHVWKVENGRAIRLESYRSAEDARAAVEAGNDA
jgi:ketosteroid isomerase-like protein